MLGQVWAAKSIHLCPNMISVEFGCIIFTTSVPTSAVKSTMIIGYYWPFYHSYIRTGTFLLIDYGAHMTFAYVLFRGMYPFNKQKYLMYYLLIAITMMNQGRRDHTKLVSNVFVTYTRGSLGVDLFLKYQSDYWHITMLFGLFFTR